MFARSCIDLGTGEVAVEYRGIAYNLVEMDYPQGWQWTVTKDHTVSAGVCETREDADCQARTFIDAIVDWAA